MPPRRITKETGLSTLACTGCRKQHLKCDGKRPTCSRCLHSGISCDYQPSRRGGRRKPLSQPLPHIGSRLLPLKPIDSRDSDCAPSSSTPTPAASRTYGEPQRWPPPEPGPPENTSNSSAAPPTDPNAADAGPLQAASLSSGPNVSIDRLWWPDLSSKDISGPGLSSSAESLSSSEDDRLLRLFYENFHPAHPILVPASMFSERAYPRFLRLTVDFAGAHYAQSAPCGQLKNQVLAELVSSLDRSPSMVQAWLIYSIILFARSDLSEAQQAFSRCTEIALEIGLNRADFASSQHPERSVEAESLRRTWWEVFIVDILMVLPMKTINFRCSAVVPEVALPCEESLYDGRSEIPQPRKILDFKRRVLSAEEIVFSSFSYRIEAATILGRVLVLNRLRECHRDHLQAIENALVSWSNHLPVQKLDILDSYGHMDEIMFQAHTIITHARMLVHIPRSNYHLLLAPTNDPFWPSAQCPSSTSSTRFIQSIKATEASRRMSDYISLCPNVQKHSPFLIPALVLCGMIQLATSKTHSEECFDHHYNRITLILGCLKNMKRTWSLAESAYHRVRSSAAALISDSMDRLSETPLAKSIPLTESTPTGSDVGNRPSAELVIAPSIMDSMLPDLDPSVLDSSCFESSLFTALPNFGID